MIADYTGPVVCKLVLVLALRQWAVATIDIQARSILRTSCCSKVGTTKRSDLSDDEAGCTAGCVGTGVQPRDTELVCERRALVVLAGDDVVTEVAESNVRHPLVREGHIHAGRGAVICPHRRTAELAQAEAATAGGAEGSRAGQRVRKPAEAAKDVCPSCRLPVSARIPLVAVKAARAALGKVVLQSTQRRIADVRSVRLQQAEQGQRLRRKLRRRNYIVRKWSCRIRLINQLRCGGREITDRTVCILIEVTTPNAARSHSLSKAR